MQQFRRWVCGGILFLCIFNWGITGGKSTLQNVSAMAPVLTSTSEPDGSLVHLVKPGENLWVISVAYGVYIQDIQRMNNMTFDQDKIIAGQKLLIPTRQPMLLTPHATASQTPLPIVNQIVSTAASYAATGTAVAGVSIVAKPTPSITQNFPTTLPIPNTGRDLSQTIQTVLLILAVLGMALIVFGLAAKR